MRWQWIDAVEGLRAARTGICAVRSCVGPEVLSSHFAQDDMHIGSSRDSQRPYPSAAEVQHHPFPAGILRRGKYLPRIGQGSFTAVKILLVDDSKLDRLRVSECLEESGFEYVAADNGTDAWEILQAPDAPTFALLDWVMPGIDGIELCRRIRTLGSNGTYIYTVMLTAKDRKKNLLTAMDAGCGRLSGQAGRPLRVARPHPGGQTDSRPAAMSQVFRHPRFPDQPAEPRGNSGLARARTGPHPAGRPAGRSHHGRRGRLQAD